MKKTMKLLLGTGIIIFSFLMLAGCASASKKNATTDDKCGYCGGKGQQKQIIITDIPDIYITRFGGVLTGDNAGRTVGYSFVNVTGTSITAQILCWEDDLHFTKDGSYKIYFLIYTDAQAAAVGNSLWKGVIPQPVQLKNSTSIAFNSFVAAN